jgi:uncharacterized membrane protein
LALVVLAMVGNLAYGIGERVGWVEEYSPALVALGLIPFVILHGCRTYGRVRFWGFVGIVFSVGWLSETISLHTGVPFGRYHYTEIMRPFVGHVPVFVLPAYALMGYLSFALVRLVLGREALVLGPVLAALAMVAWDLSMDPLRATLEGRWVWHEGGFWLGVPLSNYFGWFVTTWVMFQIFALVLARWPVDPQRDPTMLVRLAVPLAYGAFAVEYLANPFIGQAGEAWVMVSGRVMAVQDFYGQVAWMCAATMGPFILAGLLAARGSSLRRVLAFQRSGAGR